MLDTIILAGNETSKKWEGVSNKALLRINGRPMIDYVIDALRNSGNIGKIVVVGPKVLLDCHLEDKVDAVVDCDGGIMANLMAGIKSLGNKEGVIVCSCDIPFLTPEAVNDFVKQASALRADLCYPIVEKSVNLRKFPEARRTYAAVKEGSFTGGNLFYVNPDAVVKGYDLAIKLLDARKKPLKMAGILGIDFLIGLVFKSMSIDGIEEKLSKILGINVRAVISGYAEIGNDVDKPGDVAAAVAYLGRNIGSG